MTNSHVNRRQFLILEHISKKSGLTGFWLGGSITYKEVAKSLGVNFKINDYDLAIIGGERKFKSVLRTLGANSFSIIRKGPYYLKLNKAFQIVTVRKPIHLDIAIVKDIKYLGHFNWESIFWHFPSGKIYDPYDSINALKKKELMPVISVDGENPFILASRLLNLCARFNIDFRKNKKLFLFSKSLSKRIKSWEHKECFHIVYAKEHSYFNIFKAIVKSADVRSFITKIKKTGLLEAIFPELSNITIDKFDEELEGCKGVKDITGLFEKMLIDKPKQLESFKSKVKLIAHRLINS